MVIMSQLPKTFFGVPFPLNDPNILKPTFYKTDKYQHVTWFNKNDKSIVLSSGQEDKDLVANPTKIMDIEGDVKDLKIIAKGDDFVITAIEERNDGTYVRAATGIVTNDMKYDFKPCEKVKVDGELIYAYTTFTDNASMDHIYFIPKMVQESEAEAPTSDGFDRTGRADGSRSGSFNRVGRADGSHCTRLSILNAQK
jgi:hypothetical protein